MILRLSTAAERGAVAVIAALCAAFLAFFGIRDALATHFAAQETLSGFSRAVRLEPSDAENWFSLGRYWQYNFESPDLDRAVAAYHRSLSLDPISADTWLDLGAAYEALGDLPRARDAFANAKRVYPLSAQVAWSYGNFLLRQGELNASFPEIRRAVAGDPRRGAEAFSRCMRVDPDIDKILAQVIPPSRDVYLDIIQGLADEGQTADALRVWDRLAALHPQLQLRRVNSLVEALRHRQLIPDASRVWQQAASFSGFADSLQPAGSVVWDGGFESGETGFSYSWTFSPNAHGVQIRQDCQEKHSGSCSLRISFGGQSDLNFLDVCHIVPVQPAAAYSFSAWVHTRDLSTDQGVHFVLSGSQAAPLVTSDVRGSIDWQQIRADWTAPPGAQEAQICLARLPSDQPDNKIRGTLWVDDVALVPLTPGTPKP
ncbi:MAG TPA: carbohydrate binding domain-containing protein [Candidatus Dormibacteraeota bacterium]|nr:carbohydrate binding domain-containing protein [Candidatus Dormibacteraeota bacterium]